MAAEDNSPITSEKSNETPNTAPTVSSTSSARDHLKQKRARSQLSCTPCRQGKLKCNRQSDPACDQCIKRNRESACIFVPPPAKHKPPQNVKGRIRQLESMVVDLMQNQNRIGQGKTNGSVQQRTANNDVTNGEAAQGPYSQLTPPSDNDTSPQFADRSMQSSEDPEDIDTATTPFGKMKISKDEISYVGESHWGAILNSISDLKRDLGDDDEEDHSDLPGSTIDSYGTVEGQGGVQSNGTSGLGFMLGESRNVTKAELIAAVPEKRVADRLLSLWFNSPDPFKSIIHAPTFQDEYRRFWRSPNDTPTMWLGLLYSIMSLAASFGLRENDPASPQAQAVLAEVNKYHGLAASAATLADFTKPKQHTLECLMLYAAGLRSNNAFLNVWLMTGLVVRLGLRMGYHRDPSHYPSISVFHGEMRRRTWSIVSMIDVLISFQLGLPSMVKTIQSDTQPPRNLLDRDFGVSTKTLPPSRGVDELTPSSYTRAKLRIVRVFADAAEMSHATCAPSHEETMRLDRELDEAKAAVPPLLQMPDISELVTDPAEQLMCRFNLDLLYLKTKMVLHRRYMLTPFSQLTPEEQQRGIGTSRKVCLDSALRVLNHHHTIYTATQTGGQLESVKWYMGSISTHDFLLAAMVICLELSQQINDVALKSVANGNRCPYKGMQMEALEKSQRIWSDASRRKNKKLQFQGKDSSQSGEHMFDETDKASRAMAVMLDKVKKHMEAGQTPQPTAGGREMADAPMSGLVQNSGLEQQCLKDAHQPTTSPATFLADHEWAGVLSGHQWGDMTGVPDDLGLDGSGQVFFNNSGGTGTGLTNNEVVFSGATNTQSQNQPSNGVTPDMPDFSMIGDMLDVPVNLDWEMWDSHINNKDQPSSFPFDPAPDQGGEYRKYADGSGDIIQDDNAVGSTIGPIAGNAFMPGGTGPVNSGMPGMHFYSMATLNDVDFNVDVDFNKWGSEQWAAAAAGVAPNDV